MTLMMNKSHSTHSNKNIKNILVLSVVVSLLGSLIVGIYCFNSMKEREELDRQALEDTTSQRFLASTPCPRVNPGGFQ